MAKLKFRYDTAVLVSVEVEVNDSITLLQLDSIVHQAVEDKVNGWADDNGVVVVPHRLVSIETSELLSKEED